MKQDIVVEAEKRESLGKNNSRRVRHGGRVPAVVYGGRDAALALSVDPRSLEGVLHSASGANTLFGLRVGGKALAGKYIIKEHQVDPVTERILHADFFRIAMDKLIRVEVAVHPVGTAKGVKLQGGILDQPLREIEVECLPGAIPDRIDVDISELELGRSLRVGDLTIPEGVKVITDPGMPVVAVVAPTVEKVAEPVEGEPVAEEPTEPEVIKKGKEAAGEEEEGEPAKGARPEKGGKSEK